MVQVVIFKMKDKLMAQYIDKDAVVAEIDRRKQVAFGWLVTAPNDAIQAEFDLCDNILSFLDTLEVKKVKEEPVNNDLEEAYDEYYDETWDDHGGKAMVVDGYHDIWFPSQATGDFYKAGAQWQKERDQSTIELAEDHAYFAGSENTRKNLWHPADGDDLPEIDREVIVLLSNNKVCFAHRPQEYWDGKNIATEEITRYYPKRYDKGGWNIPDVKWWLDLDLPKMEK